jgi:Holliday junction resolvase
MINSRAKGNRAERDVIKILNKHFPGPFERRTMGLAGADIVAPDDFPWAIEVKNDFNLKLKHFWKPTERLHDFWDQAQRQATIVKKRPLLVAKIEGMWFCWESPIENCVPDFAVDYTLFEDWCQVHE